MDPLCPVCHVSVRATDYFCYNCGKNLHEKPLVVSPVTEYSYYLASALLPPIGLYWGFTFIKQESERVKRIGWICIVLTVAATLVAAIWSVNLVRNINDQLNQQLQGLEGF